MGKFTDGDAVPVRMWRICAQLHARTPANSDPDSHSHSYSNPDTHSNADPDPDPDPRSLAYARAL